jgi:hypothetical protein
MSLDTKGEYSRPGIDFSIRVTAWFASMLLWKSQNSVMSRRIDCSANRRSLATAKPLMSIDVDVSIIKRSYSRLQILAIVLSAVIGVMAICDYQIADRYADQSINLLLQIIG